MIEITSKDNAGVKSAALLMRDKQARRESRSFCVEGARLCGELLRHGIPIQRCYLTKAGIGQCPTLADALAETAEESFIVSEAIAQKISGTVHGQGFICVCPMLDNIGNVATICNDTRLLVLSSLQDPGNVGTMIRTAAAFGFDRVVLSGDCPDPYNPKVMRSAMGGLFSIAVDTCEDLEGFLTGLGASGVATFAAALGENALPLDQVDFTGGGTIVIGNEGSGLEEAVIRACRYVIKIPIMPQAESLNASAAAAVLLWEMYKASHH